MCVVRGYLAVIMFWCLEFNVYVFRLFVILVGFGILVWWICFVLVWYVCLFVGALVVCRCLWVFVVWWIGGVLVALVMCCVVHWWCFGDFGDVLCGASGVFW